MFEDFTIKVEQTKTAPSFPFCAIQNDQVTLYNAACSSWATGTETSPGQASVDAHGAQVGQVYIVCVKYSLKSLVGTYMDETMGCRYDFHTVINGIVVDQDPDGLVVQLQDAK